MSDELESRLSKLARDVEAAWPAVEERVAASVHAGVAHRRRARHVRDAVAGIAAVAVLVPAVVVGAGRLHPAPPAVVSGPTPVQSTSTQTPSAPVPSPSELVPSPSQPTTSPSEPTSTPSESSAPDLSQWNGGPPANGVDDGRFATLDDATIIARIAAPRTGEVWTKPVRAADMKAALSATADQVPYLVGHRGAAAIYALVTFATQDPCSQASCSDPLKLQPIQLFEIDADSIREIACPSARKYDGCAEGWTKGRAIRDTWTYYDSLTLPMSISIGNGKSLSTVETRSGSGPSMDYGDGLFMTGGALPQYTEVARLGPLRVLAVQVAGKGTSYALLEPNGALVEVAPADVPAGG